MYVTIGTPSIQFYALSPGETESSHVDPARISVRENTPVGTEIPFELELTDGQLQSYGLSFQLIVVD